MPALTDRSIQHALKRVEQRQKQENLADGEGRGTGRLVLVLKPMPTRVTADWMAQQWRDGKRTKKKIGAYPSMSLREARKIFSRDFANVIQKGRSIKIATDTRPGTVADLFQGYVANLRDAGKPSGRRQKKGSTRSPTHSVATGLHEKLSPRKSLSLFARFTNAAPVRWPTTSDAIFMRLTVGE